MFHAAATARALLDAGFEHALAQNAAAEQLRCRKRCNGRSRRSVSRSRRPARAWKSKPTWYREHRVPEAADAMAFAAGKKFGRAAARPRGQISLALKEPSCRLEGREQKLTGERPGIER